MPKLRRDGAVESEFVQTVHEYGTVGVSCVKTDPFTDLIFHCQDGQVRAHQAVLSVHSRFLRTLFLSRHNLEFDVIDWVDSVAQLSGRRASDSDFSIILPDFDKATVLRVLSCFYSGQIPINATADGTQLRMLWQCLKVDSVKLGQLQAVREDKLDNWVCPPLKITTTTTTAKPGTSGTKNGKRRKQQSSDTDEDYNNDDAPHKRSRGRPKKPSYVPAPESVHHNCEICASDIHFTSGKSAISANLQAYQRHMQSHFMDVLYANIPYLNHYYCPYKRCSLHSAQRHMFFVHLATKHDEFYPRLVRRLGHVPDDSQEYKNLTAVKKFLTTSSLLQFKVPKKMPAYLCNERDIYLEYERRHIGQDKFTCLACSEFFQSADNAVIHLFSDHGQKMFGMESLDFGENSSDSTKTQVYKCAIVDCGFETLLQGSFIGHMGFRHGYFDRVDIESLISNVKIDRVFAVLKDYEDVKTSDAQPQKDNNGTPAKKTKAKQPAAKKSMLLFSQSDDLGLMFECTDCEVECLAYDSMMSHLERKHDYPVVMQCRDCAAEQVEKSRPSQQQIQAHRCKLMPVEAPKCVPHYELLGDTSTFAQPPAVSDEEVDVVGNGPTTSNGLVKDSSTLASQIYNDIIKRTKNSTTNTKLILLSSGKALDKNAVVTAASSTSKTEDTCEIIELDSD